MAREEQFQFNLPEDSNSNGNSAYYDPNLLELIEQRPEEFPEYDQYMALEELKIENGKEGNNYSSQQTSAPDRLGLYSGRTGIKKKEVDNKGKKGNLPGQLIVATDEEKGTDFGKRIDVRTGEIVNLESINSELVDEEMPDGIDILGILKKKRTYPLPVAYKWINTIMDKINWKGINKDNEYELKFGNFLILKDRLRELIKRKHFKSFTQMINRLLSEESLNEELLSKLVFIKNGTRLYDPWEIDAYTDLRGHIIALPAKTSTNADWGEYGQRFIYVANASEKKEIYGRNYSKCKFRGGTRNLYLGDSFQIRNGKAYLLDTQYLRE
jgi:hypothetical protein